MIEAQGAALRIVREHPERARAAARWASPFSEDEAAWAVEAADRCFTHDGRVTHKQAATAMRTAGHGNGTPSLPETAYTVDALREA